ncbi:hypothetical protein [uncultured Shewanella sp.]|nr:hypothetical protein [uncultured Shewanella sp.]
MKKIWLIALLLTLQACEVEDSETTDATGNDDTQVTVRTTTT